MQYAYTPEPGICPLCGSNNAKLLYEIDSEDVAKNFLVKERDPQKFEQLVTNVNNTWKSTTCKVIQCDNCGLCYTNPFVAGDNEFYNLIYGGTGKSRWKWEFEVTFQKIKEIMGGINPNETTLLEIGAADGTFIKKISPYLIPKQNILCTDYSENCKKLIEQYGIKCETIDITKTKNPKFKNKFSILCMFQVLEHMDSIDYFFKAAYFLTKPNADIFIAVPNDKMIAIQELYGELLDEPPHHTSRWNKKCFEIASQKYGFKLLDYKIEPCRLIPAFKQIIIYKYKRKRQIRGNIYCKSALIKNNRLRRIAEIMLVAYLSITSLTILPKLQGNSQWVHLRK
ncbi:MAG: methyltransferase domain-containing protein [Candidatus Nanoarchaeia archaeon]